MSLDRQRCRAAMGRIQIPGNVAEPMPSRITEVVERDGATSLWKIKHPDGSVTLNGINGTNQMLQRGQVVLGIPREDGLIALELRDVTRTQEPPQEEVTYAVLIGDSTFKPAPWFASYFEPGGSSDRTGTRQEFRLWIKVNNEPIRLLLTYDSVKLRSLPMKSDSLVSLVEFTYAGNVYEYERWPSGFSLLRDGFPEFKRLRSFTMLSLNRAFIEIEFTIKMRGQTWAWFDEGGEGPVKVVQERTILYQSIVDPGNGVVVAEQQIFTAPEKGLPTNAYYYMDPISYREQVEFIEWQPYGASTAWYLASGGNGQLWGTINAAHGMERPSPAYSALTDQVGILEDGRQKTVNPCGGFSTMHSASLTDTGLYSIPKTPFSGDASISNRIDWRAILAGYPIKVHKFSGILPLNIDENPGYDDWLPSFPNETEIIPKVTLPDFEIMGLGNSYVFRFGQTDPLFTVNQLTQLRDNPTSSQKYTALYFDRSSLFPEIPGGRMVEPLAIRYLG